MKILKIGERRSNSSGDLNLVVISVKKPFSIHNFNSGCDCQSGDGGGSGGALISK